MSGNVGTRAYQPCRHEATVPTLKWRQLMRQMFWGALLALLVIVPSYAADEARLTLPKSGIVKVAFVVSDQATLIDIAGPMQVFDQVQSPGTTGFRTFTVSETRAPIHAGTMTI